jgi:hypothetical protein
MSMSTRADLIASTKQRMAENRASHQSRMLDHFHDDIEVPGVDNVNSVDDFLARLSEEGDAPDMQYEQEDQGS